MCGAGFSSVELANRKLSGRHIIVFFLVFLPYFCHNHHSGSIITIMKVFVSATSLLAVASAIRTRSAANHASGRLDRRLQVAEEEGYTDDCGGCSPTQFCGLDLQCHTTSCENLYEFVRAPIWHDHSPHTHTPISLFPVVATGL